MILRRFNEHLKNQNWFAVILDLLVVIAGIYIGLQVDAWNSSRNDRQLEREYLERMLADMEDSIVAQKAQIEDFDAGIVAVDYIAERQRAGSFDGADASKVNEGLNNINWVAPPETNMITIRELQATGNISLIQDVEIRAGIGELERSFSRFEHDADLIIGLMTASAPEVMTWSYMRPHEAGMHRSVVEEEDPSFGYTNEFDPERMLAHPDAARITSWISGWSKYQGSVMMQHHLDTIRFRDLVSRKLEEM